MVSRKINKYKLDVMITLPIVVNRQARTPLEDALPVVVVVRTRSSLLMIRVREMPFPTKG